MGLWPVDMQQAIDLCLNRGGSKFLPPTMEQGVTANAFVIKASPVGELWRLAEGLGERPRASGVHQDRNESE